MKNNWDLTYQNMFLILLLLVVIVWLLGTRNDYYKADLRRKYLERETMKLDSVIASMDSVIASSEYRVDSLTQRDSILISALKNINNYKLINDTTISNDSLRLLVRKRTRTK